MFLKSVWAMAPMMPITMVIRAKGKRTRPCVKAGSSTKIRVKVRKSGVDPHLRQDAAEESHDGVGPAKYDRAARSTGERWPPSRRTQPKTRTAITESQPLESDMLIRTRKVGHVQRSISAVNPATPSKKKPEATLLIRAYLSVSRSWSGRSTERHQEVAGQKHQFEEDEQVKDVARQEGTVVPRPRETGTRRSSMLLLRPAHPYMEKKRTTASAATDVTVTNSDAGRSATRVMPKGAGQIPCVEYLDPLVPDAVCKTAELTASAEPGRNEAHPPLPG